jgi:nucleoside-diphosphate-sugar epimerase
MKLLISGATGFIGAHLITRLQKEKHTIFIVVRPSTKQETLPKKIKTYVFDNDIENLTTFMQKEKFDGVIHLASLFLAQHTSEDIKNLIDSNVFFGAALLQAATKSNTPWFINTGTFWQHYKNKAYSPVNLYAASKQAFESLAQYYVETTTINFVTIKLSDTFGKNDTRPKIFNLLTKLRTTGETLLMSPGKQVLDISYIENVIDGYMRMITLLSGKDGASLRGKSFAISAKKKLTLQQLVKVFEKVTKSKLSISWGGRPYRDREVMVPWNKGTPIPGHKQTYSLEDGIREILEIA